MKIILGLIIIAILVVGCAGGSPKSVVQQFIKAAEKGDTKAIEKLVTADTTEEHIAFYVTAIAALGGEKSKSITETIDGDTAKVTVEYEKGDNATYSLKKVDGKWKLDLTSK